MNDSPGLEFGEELRRERLMREISLEEISPATKISVRLLTALEQSDVSKTSGTRVHARVHPRLRAPPRASIPKRRSTRISPTWRATTPRPAAPKKASSALAVLARAPRRRRALIVASVTGILLVLGFIASPQQRRRPQPDADGRRRRAAPVAFKNVGVSNEPTPVIQKRSAAAAVAGRAAARAGRARPAPRDPRPPGGVIARRSSSTRTRGRSIHADGAHRRLGARQARRDAALRRRATDSGSRSATPAAFASRSTAVRSSRSAASGKSSATCALPAAARSAADLRPCPPRDPPNLADLVTLLREGEAPLEIRRSRRAASFPLDRDDQIRALLAVVLDEDPEIAAAAQASVRASPPDDLSASAPGRPDGRCELDASPDARETRSCSSRSSATRTSPTRRSRASPGT